MARYDYKCPSCETVFEVEHPMTEHPVVHCPTCNAVAQQVFGASGIVFKGSGFYNTDQRGSGSRSVPTPATTTSTKESSESSASETKSAESKDTAKAADTSSKEGSK